MLNFIFAWLTDHDVHFHDMAMAREAQQILEAPHALDNNRASDTQSMDCSTAWRMESGDKQLKD